MLQIPGMEVDGDEQLPEKGDVVTFSYNVRNAVMVEPRVTRVRKDLEWQDVLHSHFQDSPNGNIIRITTHIVLTFELEATKTALNFSTSSEYWTSKRGRNTRVLLENIARSKNMDPLLAQTWYSIPRQLVMDVQVSVAYFGALNFLFS